MKIVLSNWLLSTLRLHRYPIFICWFTVGNTSYYQRVRLVRVEVDPFENKITVTWIFNDFLNFRLQDCVIFVFKRYDDSHMSHTNLQIPSDYKWGEVVLVENIRLIGAV